MINQPSQCSKANKQKWGYGLELQAGHQTVISVLESLSKQAAQCLELTSANLNTSPKKPCQDCFRARFLTGCSLQHQALFSQSTYLRSQQRLSIIITRHENFHYCYQTPKSIFLFQVQKCNCYQSENRVYLEKKIVIVSQNVLGTLTIKPLFLFSRDKYINRSTLNSKTVNEV